jgi:hypothetical protein|tara:strand:- start:756 stop:1232 length:477 start_codon:yes stop_codon:yes gene_type:complete
MTDKMIICERCGGDAAYVQEVNEKIKNYQCMGCGFLSNTLFKKGEELFETMFETLPNLYRELMGEDESGKIWIPSTVNIPEKGMVFANGTGIENWKWAAVQAVPVKEEEKEKFPIPNQKGKFYKHRMDMTTMKEFEEKDYLEALDCIGVFNNSLEDVK